MYLIILIKAITTRLFWPPDKLLTGLRAKSFITPYLPSWRRYSSSCCPVVKYTFFLNYVLVIFLFTLSMRSTTETHYRNTIQYSIYRSHARFLWVEKKFQRQEQIYLSTYFRRTRVGLAFRVRLKQVLLYRENDRRTKRNNTSRTIYRGVV